MEWVYLGRTHTARCPRHGALGVVLVLALSGCAPLTRLGSPEGTTTRLPEPPPALRPPPEGPPPRAPQAPPPPTTVQTPPPPAAPVPVTPPVVAQAPPVQQAPLPLVPPPSVPAATPPPVVAQAPPVQQVPLPTPLTPAPTAPVPTPPPVVVQAPPPASPAPSAPRPVPVQAPGRMPTLPLTQIDDRLIAADLDNRTFSLTFGQPVAIHDVLLVLVRGTSLSVVPDPSVSGSFIGELKNVTVRQALDLMLRPLGLDYSVAGGFIRVFRREPETRLFNINYIASQRTGTTTVGTAPRSANSAQVTTTIATDLFADITKGVQALLSDRATFNVDRKAGLLQVVDFPERLDRVAVYLDTVHDRVQRQVRIDVRVLEVELNDANRSIDWAALSDVAPAATTAFAPRSLTGLRVADVARLVAALERQGKVSTLADPRIVAINNEPAIVRASARRTGSAPRGPADGGADDEVTLSVTPQIAGEGIVMLNVSPIVTRSYAADATPLGAETMLAADILARVADGETIALTGFATDRFAAGTAPDPRVRNRTVPVMTRKRTELLILLTPRILTSAAD